MTRILAGIFAACSLYAQAGPTTFIVTTLADSGPGSLRQAIVNANAAAGPSRITFAGGLHGAIVLTSGALAVAGSTEIDGPGAEVLSVSGNNGGRVFEIESTAKVSIQRLSIENGHAGGDVVHPGLGGGIYVAGGALSLNSVTVANNRAIGTASIVVGVPPGPAGPGGGAGGGIYVAGGTLTISNSLLVNNQALGGASGDGNAGGNGLGGGIFNQGGIVTVSTATFANNQAVGGAGGAGGTGGGSGSGGGIYNGPGGLSVTAVVLAGNQAIGGAGGSGGNGGAGLGGGIANSGPSSVSQSWVLNNNAQGGTAGAGGTSGGGLGGGIFNGSGGAVVLQEGSLLALNSALGGNCAAPGCGGTSAPAGNAFGGGLYGATNSVSTIGVARIVGNRAIGATGIGGGIYVLGTLALSPAAIVVGNFASTADPNLFPPGA
jgi:hypothetical protein